MPSRKSVKNVHIKKVNCMNIFVLCATLRGKQFLEKLFELRPSDNFYVFSFAETPWEPEYLEQIKELSQSHQAHFFETTNIADHKFSKLWDSVQPDIMFLVSWRYLIPVEIANKSKLASVVFHDSLLPAYRGFSPTCWAIINGESRTGVTMFHLAEEPDSGDIIDQVYIPIGIDDTITELTETVTKTYLELLEKNLPLIINGQAPRIPQDHRGATFTCKRIPEDNEIDWNSSVSSIYNLIRGVTHPYPGAYTWLNGRKLIIWSAVRLHKQRKFAGRVPGAILEVRKDSGVIVMAGDGQLLIKSVQHPGEDEICAAEILKSLSFRLGRYKHIDNSGYS